MNMISFLVYFSELDFFSIPRFVYILSVFSFWTCFFVLSVYFPFLSFSSVFQFFFIYESICNMYQNLFDAVALSLYTLLVFKYCNNFTYSRVTISSLDHIQKIKICRITFFIPFCTLFVKIFYTIFIEFRFQKMRTIFFKNFFLHIFIKKL